MDAHESGTKSKKKTVKNEDEEARVSKVSPRRPTLLPPSLRHSMTPRPGKNSSKRSIPSPERRSKRLKVAEESENVHNDGRNGRGRIEQNGYSPKENGTNDSAIEHVETENSPHASASESRDLNSSESGVSHRSVDVPEETAADQEESLQSPVKEISFARTDISMSPPSSRKKRLSRAPSDLDEETMRIIKRYLSQNRFVSPLDDDEVTQFMIRTMRVSSRQAEYHLNAVGETDESDTSLFLSILKEEEDHATGHDLVKKMTATLKDEQQFEPNEKTLRWLKRAAGLHRSSAVSQTRQSVLDANDGNVRVKTRTAAKKTKMEKRERGLKVLTGVIDDLENEHGRKFRVRKWPQRQEPPPSSSSASPRTKREDSKKANTNKSLDARENGKLSSKMFKPRHTWDDQQQRLVAAIQKRRILRTGEVFDSTDHVFLSGFIVDGRYYDPVSVSMWTDGRRGPRSMQQKNNRERTGGGVRRPSGRPVPSLRLINWNNRYLSSTLEYRKLKDKIKSQVYRRQVNRMLPSHFTDAGIVCRTPDWPRLGRKVRMVLDPPRTRHSSRDYAVLSRSILNCLRSKARFWAMCEFFYSDIDRNWFNRNTFLEQVAALGVKPNHKFSRAEWKAIRRRINRKPRRFSKSFIASELQDLEKYRHTVREMQRKSIQQTPVASPYDVPGLLPKGTKVTMYSESYRDFRRGIIIRHGKTAGEYMVMPEDRELEVEVCKDTLVASHGNTNVIMPASNVFASCPPLNQRVGTPVGSFQRKYPELDSVNIFDEMRQMEIVVDGKEIETTSHPAKTRAKNSAAERELLGRLLAQADTSTRRKEMLLDALHKFNIECASELPVGSDVGKSCLSRVRRDLYIWLRANLEETNDTLASIWRYIRLMYSGIYTANESLKLSRTCDFLTTAMDALQSSQRETTSAAMDWTVKLACHSDAAGDAISSAIVSENKNRKSRKSADIYPMADRLRVVGQVLFSATCGQGMAAASACDDFSPAIAAIATGVNRLSTLSSVPHVKDEDGLCVEVKSAWENAVSELESAMELYSTELCLSETRTALGKRSV